MTRNGTVNFGLRTTLILLATVCAGFCSTQTAQASSKAVRDQSPEYSALLQQARSGPVSVIVGFELPSYRTDLTPGTDAYEAQVDLIATAQAALETAIKRKRLTVTDFGWMGSHVPAISARVDAKALRALPGLKGVQTISANHVQSVQLQESIPLIGGDATDAAGFRGAGQTVAVIDTGVDSTHPFLNGRVVGEACFSANMCPGNRRGAYAGAARPCPAGGGWHGTAVSGIIAGGDSSLHGVARGASILAVLATSAGFGGIGCGTIDDAALVESLGWVRDQTKFRSIAAVNLSLGSSTVFTSKCDSESPDVYRAVAALKALNVVTIAASGNGTSSTGLSSPACLSNVVAVSGVDENDQVPSYANNNANVSLLAPSSNITSSAPFSFSSSGFVTSKGTSFAAPHIAGAFAVYKAAHPDATNDQIVRRFFDTGLPVRDSRNGITKPRIQLDRALGLSPRPLDVFAAGAGEDLQHVAFDGNWFPLESLDGSLASNSTPAAVSWGPNRIDVFARGADSALWHRAFDGQWHPWESMGGFITSDPTAVSWGSNRIDVFARGSGDALYHLPFDGQWRSWESLGGVLTSQPTAVSWGNNRIDVFARGTDLALDHIAFDGHWSAWEGLGGQINSDIAITSWGPDRIDLFARGAGDGLYHKAFDGQWRAWEDMGGVLTSNPTAVSWGPNRIDVFGRGSNSGLYHKAFDGQWHPWEALGGELTSPVSAASWGSNRIDVFGRGTNNGLYHMAFDGQWHPWEAMGGILSSAPCALVRTTRHSC